MADFQQHAEQPAGVARIDDAVVPQARATCKGIGTPVHESGGVPLEFFQCNFIQVTGALHFLFADDAQDFSRLGGAHHCGARIGPGKNKARIETASTHRIVTGAIRTSDHNAELGHAGIGHGLDHFRAVLDDALLFDFGANHKASGVVQEQERCAALVAQLDKLCRLVGAPGRDGTVVADNTQRVSLDADVATDGLLIEFRFEIQKR